MELHGRDREVSALCATLDAGATVALVGEAGAGATAVIDAVASARPEAVRTAALRSLAGEPMVAFERLLRDRLPADPGEVADRIERWLRGRPLLVEDLHWAHDDTVATVSALVARVPLVVTERDPGAHSRTLGGDVLRLGGLPEQIARQIARDAGVAAEHIDEVVRAAGGNPGILVALASGRPSPRLDQALAAPILDASPQARRLAAWLAHGGGAPAGGDVAFDELVEIGVIVVDDHGPRLRLGLFGDAAERSLDPTGIRQLHADLARHLPALPARAARHHELAGEVAEASRVAEVAAREASVGPERTELLAIVARGAAPEQQRARWLDAAAAAVDDAEFDTALSFLAHLKPGTPAGGELARTAGSALIGLGRFQEAARALADGGDATRAELARLEAWPLLRPGAASERDPVTDVIAGRRPGPSTSAEAARVALIAAALPGRAELVAALVAASSGAPRLGIAEAAAASVVADQLTLGASSASGPELERWRTDPVIRAHRDVLAAHQALAIGDSGATGEALGLLDPGAEPESPPLAHACLLSWARSEIELLAGRPRKAVTAAVEVVRLAPDGFPIVDLALVVIAWASELGVVVDESGAVPLGSAASAEHDAIGRFVSGDLTGAREQFLRAADGWESTYRRGALRARWAAAEAGRRLGQGSAIAELEAVETDADALSHRYLVARARASLREAGVRRAPKRGGHASGLTRREVEVLELIGEGLTSGEIGPRLGVARSTVDTLADSARRKLGARNRRHAALLLREVGR